MKEKTLFEDFFYEGKWWTPDNPENKIHGTLEYKHNEHIILNLSGIFRYDKSDPRNHPFKPIIILGLTNDGKRITLIRSYQIKHTTHITGISRDGGEFGTSKFISEYLLIGKHIYDKDEKQFYSIYVNYTYLEQWLNFNPFKWEPAGKGILVSTRDPIEYKIRIESIQTTLSVNSVISKEEGGWTELQLGHRAYFGIIPDSPNDLDCI
jgi:hypothetical protein